MHANHSSRPWIIWTEPRSVGTALSKALKAISCRPEMWDDPFVDGDRPGELVDVYRDWRRIPDPGHFRVALAGKMVFKHVPANFCKEFNADLARGANFHGYHHIHLIRRSAFAQLASRGVAGQLDAWSRDETRDKSADAAFAPFDVPDLIRKYDLGVESWAAVERHLSYCLTVRSEDLVHPDQTYRRAVLRGILGFIEAPLKCLGEISDIINRGEDTDRLWSRVPNIEELSNTLTARGIL
jgi:hypothetical protein